MRVSRYVRILEDRLGALLGLDNDRLLVVRPKEFPRRSAIALAGYAPQLVLYFLTGSDADLSLNTMANELHELGLVQLENGEWTHPLGDETADLIVAGVLEPDTLSASELALIRRYQQPSRVEVEALQVSPGVFRWSEPKGVWVVPMFRGRRLLEK
ncbi:MAG TPA: hypothetical protein VN700_06505 [Vicinamibacterales bacterium]|nr:hypothetical protein [Vicinamibacterales bacterium]